MMAQPSPRWPLVRIRWLDSSAPHGWQRMADWSGMGSLECESVGYLYAEDATSKTVVPHFAFFDDDTNRQGGGVMVIPAGAVLSIERLVSGGLLDTAPSPPCLAQPTLEKRDLAEYGVARLRDQIFDAVRLLWRRRQKEGWTENRIAESIGRDPGWVSTSLSAPGNWTLVTPGELIQGLHGEVEIRVAALEDPIETTTVGAER